MADTRVDTKTELRESTGWHRPDYKVVAASLEITAYLGQAR
jgi:hypothetical protein